MASIYHYCAISEAFRLSVLKLGRTYKAMLFEWHDQVSPILEEGDLFSRD